MSINEMEAKAREIKELQHLADEAAEAITALQDEIKAAMTAQDKDTITAGAYKITWKPVTSSRIDTAALKKALPDLAEQFTKVTTARRFVIA